MSEATSDPAADLELLGATMDEFEQFHEARRADAKRVASAVSGWSIEQHLYHLALATDLALGHVRALLAGKGALIREVGQLDPRAAEVLNARRAERGVAEAPRMVRPPEEIETEYLTLELQRVQDGIAALRLRCGEIPSAPGWIPHQALGTLRAEHWLRFAALHAQHHLAIARDIGAELGG